MKLRSLQTSMLIISLYYFAGCGGGGGGDVFTPPADNDQLLTSSTIGTEGGTITAEELTVTIPAGSFASDRELKIYRSEDDDPFGDAAVSPLYKLGGLPATFSQPLQVVFPAAGKSENTLIALGETSFSNSAGGMVTGYRVLETIATDSTVVAVIPAAADPVDDGGAGWSAHLVQLADYADKAGDGGPGLNALSTTHFRVYYPMGHAAHAADLGTWLESAYAQLGSWGFVYGARTRWPIVVMICELNRDRFGEFVPSVLGDNYGTLNFNSLLMSETTDMKVTAGHEFFHLVQALYDNRNRFSKAKGPSDRYWLDEACSVWSERTWTGDPSFLSPKARDGHQRLPFHHFHVPADGDYPDHHGYGMSALIQYLVNRAGANSLGYIYDYILAHGNDPVAAITSMMADRLHEEFSYWHPLFARELIHGDLYSDVNATIAVSYQTETWNIDGLGETEKTFDYDYAAGACRFFILNLDNPHLSEDAVLTLELEDSSETMEVFSFHGSGSTFLDAGQGVNVDHLVDLQNDDQHILVMVVNSFLGSHYDADSNIILHADVQEKPVFRRGRIWVSGPGTMTVHETNSSGLDTTYTVENRTAQFDGSIYLDPVVGSSHGTTFTAYYDTMVVEENIHRSGTISISVDDADNPTQVTSFTLDAVEVRPYNGETDNIDNIKTYSITGFGIPLAYPSQTHYEFKILDENAASHIDDVEYVEKDYWSGTTEYTLTDLAENYIIVKLES